MLTFQRIERTAFMTFFYLIQLLHVLLFLQSENSNKGSRRRTTENHNVILKPQLYD